jgi:flagellin
MANRNVQDGISMLQTAEGALGNINNMLIRIKELAVQASSGTNAFEEKNTIQNEINEMINGIEDIAQNTKFNGVKILADGPSEINMPVGANSGDIVKIPTYNLVDTSNPSSVILKLRQIDVINSSVSANNSDTVDGVIDEVLGINSKYGALENRFESCYNNLNQISDQMQSAESDLRDADIAYEMMEYAKSNILVEAGNAMMAQTNRFPQDILRILENMK